MSSNTSTAEVMSYHICPHGQGPGLCLDCQTSPIRISNVQPHRCPCCSGSGLVSRPPWIAGDSNFWTGTSCGPWPCKACAGTGVLWR